MLKKKNGFTIIELIIIIIIFLVFFGYFILIKTIGMGNFWYTQEGVLKELKIDHPHISKIFKTTRNVFDKSVIVVEENGKKITYLLDSDIFFNYDILACKK